MPLPEFNYTRSWRNPADFPTYENREEKVRDDMQSLFDEIRDALNNLSSAVSASTVPFSPTAAIVASTVQAAIENLYEQMQAMSQGSIPDGTITTAKLADGAVTAAKLASSLIDELSSLPVAKLEVSTSRDLARTDEKKALYCTNSSAITLTIPTNTDAAIPVGTEIRIYRAGTGVVNIEAAEGVTLFCPGAEASLTSRYSSVRLKKWDTNTWGLEGDALAPAGYLANFSSGLAPAGNIILTEDVHFYDSESDLPEPGVAGRLAFVKV